ncbi:MAG: hypothetical protein Q4F84_11320, partial [Fibrobacter sp.]|nr:hypothetical protein [Fibrobacter sp.]
MKIVMLEGDNLGNDIDLSLFEKLGDFTLYGKTKQSQVFERLKDADIAIVNKLLINEDSLKDLDKLKLICVTATGINNIDLEYTKTRQLPVTNVSGYSTDSVAQHTFALL